MALFNKLRSKKEREVIMKKEESPAIAAQETASTHGTSAAVQFQPILPTLLRQAWITEKAGRLSSGRQYVFIVDAAANKSEIKKAVESIYAVTVSSVNVLVMKGKPRRLGRSAGRTSQYKKAVVTLVEGDKLELMPT